MDGNNNPATTTGRQGLANNVVIAKFRVKELLCRAAMTSAEPSEVSITIQLVKTNKE